jgi:plastocyanin
MRRLVPSLAAAVLIAGVHAVPSTAGPEKIVFPAKYGEGVLYTTVDRHDTKQYRELWGTPDAVAAMKAGRPLPSGSVLTLVQYKARLDASGAPVKGADGRFVKGDLIAYTVMEKRAGWGAEYPAEWRNGEWEYAAFGADGTLNTKANYTACFQCHKPHEKTDFVISRTKLVPGTAASAAVPTPAAAVVNIQDFTFGPARLMVDKGMPIMWINADDSPHQVTVTTGAVSRSAVLPKGARHTQSFATAGVYDYICGLHPGMKGQIEVR